MTKSLSFSVHNSAFIVIRDQWSMANGKCMVNGKWPTVNGSEGAV